MTDTAQAVALSALEREASLGAHVRLDNSKRLPTFSKPHSIAVYRTPDSNYTTYKLVRPTTSWYQLLTHLIHDRKRKLGMKILRALPLMLRDRIVANKFRSAMGEITSIDSDKNTSQSVTQRV